VIKYRESNISAHHNYLVNTMLTPGFTVGNPEAGQGFYFLADIVLSGESTPRISTRIMDRRGHLLTHLRWNRIHENPGKCIYESVPGGFRILSGSGEILLTVCTESFPNGYLTRVSAQLFNEKGDLRIEASSDGIRVHGEADLALSSPFIFKTK